MRQHNIWCVYVCSVWRGMLDCSPTYLSTQEKITWRLQLINKIIYKDKKWIKLDEHNIQWHDF